MKKTITVEIDESDIRAVETLYNDIAEIDEYCRDVCEKCYDNSDRTHPECERSKRYLTLNMALGQVVYQLMEEMKE